MELAEGWSNFSSITLITVMKEMFDARLGGILPLTPPLATDSIFGLKSSDFKPNIESVARVELVKVVYESCLTVHT